MGHVAGNAVANAAADFPKEPRKISQRPYPGPLAPGSRYFVSEYFHRFNQTETPGISAAFDAIRASERLLSRARLCRSDPCSRRLLRRRVAMTDGTFTPGSVFKANR